MGKSSSKRRKRRERRKKELELLRGVSLVDGSTPTPNFDHNNDDNGSPPEPSREQLTNYGKPVASASATSLSQDTLSPIPQSTLHPQHESTNTTTTASSANLSPAHSIMNVPVHGPKALPWKRIDFVLPRALGQDEFLFAHQPGAKEHVNLRHGVSASRKDKDDGAKSKSSGSNKSESIDDILFPDKRKRQRSDSTDPAEATAEALSVKQTRHPKEDKEVKEDVFPAARRKKLAATFERVHRESIDEQVTAEAFVDAPVRERKAAEIEKSTNRETKTAGNSHVQEGLNHQAQKKRKVDSTAPNGDHKPHDNASHLAVRGEVSGRSMEEAVRDEHGRRPRANSTDGELNLPQGGLCDERVALEAYKWNKTLQRFPRGFHNLGNTCFLNATLQCLAHVPPLCQTLFAVSENKMRQKSNGSHNNNGKKITFSLCSLFQQAHGIGMSNSVSGGVAPRGIVNALPAIGSCGSRNGYQFRQGRQEDAHEFLVHLLDAMNDGELRAAGINQHISGWRDRLPVSRLDETTFIHRIFGGYFRSQVRCQSCNYKSNTYDPFLDLSLEISKKSCSSIMEALSQFTRKETLDAENQWKCSGCKRYVCPTKQLTVFRPPLTLCIQLKRFAFNNSFGFGMNGFSKMYGSGGSKISKPIDFPSDLNLPLSDKRSCAYSLTGIVIHVGGSASSGHYTACVKRPGKSGTSQWFYLDDLSVESMSEKAVLRQKNAYLLFYCRKEVKIEFPSPPPRSMSASEAAEFGRNRVRARADSFSKENPEKETRNSKQAAITQTHSVKLLKLDKHPLSSHVEPKREIEASSNDVRDDLSGSDSKSGTTDEVEDQKPGRFLSKTVSAADTKDPLSADTNGSESSSSSDGSTSEDEAQDDTATTNSKKEGHTSQANVGKPSTPEQEKKTRVIINSSDSRGKVKAMFGPRKRKLWQSKAKTIASKEKNYQLLGNLEVSQWDDDDVDAEKGQIQQGALGNLAQGQRKKIIGKMQKEEQSLKRKMHLDRWDSYLDHGRQKKVKVATKLPFGPSNGEGTKNQFQSLQASVQKFVQGKAKGVGWTSKKSDRQKSRKNHSGR